jgi:hypothetical protein
MNRVLFMCGVIWQCNHCEPLQGFCLNDISDWLVALKGQNRSEGLCAMAYNGFSGMSRFDKRKIKNKEGIFKKLNYGKTN